MSGRTTSGRVGLWVTLAGLAVGAVVVAVLGLWTYMGTTAERLHPRPEDVPSSSLSMPPPRWAAAVEDARRVVRTVLSDQNVPGLSVAVGAQGELAWAEGFGWADLDRRTVVGPDTRFRLGTASTVLTSAAAGLLVEEGRLRLDDEIQAYVPEFPRKDRPITLRQVMGHVAGLRTDGGDESPLLGTHCLRPADALPHFAAASLLTEPGERFRVSRFGWIVVSAAVEAASGEPFLRFVRKQVFEPLGLHDTTADDASRTAPEQATSYFPRFAADLRYGLDPMRPIDLSCYAGAGVFVSTPSDLVRFGLAMADGRLLRPDTMALLQTPQRTSAGEDTGYGLGWRLERAAVGGEDTLVAGHDGDVLGGMVASLVVIRDRGLVVAVTSNSSYADTHGVAMALARAFASPGLAH
ncbi:MAG: serine hydrolase domain-containing protein [Vicinamibacterales bacterium]